MNGLQAALLGTLVAALVAQAVLSSRRLLVVMTGAGLCCLLSAVLGGATPERLLGAVPWGVLVILVSLGLISQVFADSRLFDRLAVLATRWSNARPGRVAVVFAVGMYAVSGVVNNLTALVLVLPVMHALLRLVGTDQRFASWSLGLLLVACNLGGAATPIGDFPAILLMSRGGMSFGGYLVRALPATLVGLGLLLLAVAALRPARALAADARASALACAVVEALHRRVKVDRRLLVPATVTLGAMVLGWLLLPAVGIGPELVCWLGTAALLLWLRSDGEQRLRRGMDAEAVLFLLALFVMVGAVKEAGLFDVVARGLLRLPVQPWAQLVLFLLLAGALTGLFSAGPSMAAMLEVAAVLAKQLPGPAVYVGLALAVCAGSSLFLTAATSGPLCQALTERAALVDLEGKPIRFGFTEFLPVGLLSFCLIELVAVGYALAALRFGW